MSAIRRLGKKSDKKTRDKIISFFPPHISYFEPFFGGGGMFFGKERAKYNFLNDFDSDVATAFQVITTKRSELIEYIEIVPYHTAVFQYFSKMIPKTDIEKVAKFLILSAWGYMGKPNTLRLGTDSSKAQLLLEIEKTYRDLAKSENRFTSCDFRDFFKQIGLRKPTELNPDRKDDKLDSFAYLDPPYLGTANNYGTPVWTKTDVVDLMDIMATEGIKMAMSEFDHPFILAEAEKRGFHIQIIGERRNMGNRRTEILIMNYELENTLF